MRPDPMTITLPAPGAPARPDGGLAGAVVLVLLFWWLATGAIVAVERNDTTRLIGVLVATWLMVLAGVMAIRVRDDTSPRGALLGFAVGSLAWLWVSALLYAGVIVGPSVPVPPELGQAPSIPLALRAIVATGWHDLLALATIGGLYLIPGRNPLAWQTLGLFWIVQQVAKVNVFVGVVNNGIHFLPPRLAFLTAFFGPTRLHPLLPVSIVAAAVVAGWLIRGARRAEQRFERWRLALLSVLVVLAAVEYAVLAIPDNLPLWDVFLRLRGG
jgi:putative photosynthetic complex assembly protein 2